MIQIKYWLGLYGLAIVGGMATIAASTLAMAGLGLMFLAPIQTVKGAALGGMLIGCAFICAYIVAKCLK